MPDTFSFEDREQFVYCRHTGPFQLESLVNLARVVNEFCLTNGRPKILVDITQSHGEMKNYERFQHAAIISEFMSTTLKIALLGRDDQVLEERIWEAATRNRMLQTKVFTDQKMAEKWLQS